MKTVPVAELAADSQPGALYHRSGQVLLEEGDTLTTDMLSALSGASITEVHQLDPTDDPALHVRSCRFEARPVDQLKENESLPSDLTDENGALLLKSGSAVTSELIQNFVNREITEVFMQRDTSELGLEEFDAFKSALSSTSEKKVTGSPDAVFGESGSVDVNALFDNDMGFAAESSSDIGVKPSGVALEEYAIKHDSMQMRTGAQKEAFNDFYKGNVQTLAIIFNEVKRGARVAGEVFEATAKKMIEGMLHDKELLINLSNITASSYNVLIHSINTTIVAVNIGMVMGYNPKQVLDLTFAALLHDVGMLQLPKKLVQKPDKHNSLERKNMMRHPTFGMDMLTRMEGIPFSTPLVVYQAHERLNGTGYPRQRTHKNTHSYAKVVMVAETYVNKICHRSHRQAYAPHEAMTYILRETKKGAFDPSVVRAFLDCVSLFPLGSYVKLTTGEIAKVVAVNREDHSKPVVSIVKKDGSEVDEYRVDLMKVPEGVAIEKGLSERDKQSEIARAF